MKLLLSFLLVGLVPLGITGYTASSESKQALEYQVFSQLEAIRAIKKNQVEAYFADRQLDIHSLQQTISTLTQNTFERVNIVNELKKSEIEDYFNERYRVMLDVQSNLRYTTGLPLFTAAFKRGLNSPEYKSLVSQREKGFETFRNTWRFYDVLLIDAEANVVYSIDKKSDLGTNLKTGALKDSGLAKVYKKARNQPAVQDEVIMNLPKSRRPLLPPPYTTTTVCISVSPLSKFLRKILIRLPKIVWVYLLKQKVIWSDSKIIKPVCVVTVWLKKAILVK